MPTRTTLLVRRLHGPGHRDTWDMRNGMGDGECLQVTVYMTIPWLQYDYDCDH
jgi:hypothetical protein